MKFFTTLSLAAMVSGHALPKAQNQLVQRDFQSVTLVFQAAAASYNLTILADGQEHFTNSDLNVNLIDAPDFDAYHLCSFKTGNGEATLVPSLTQRPEDPWPINQIAVGPPQAIVSVTCSGTCVGVYGDCFNSTNGQYIGSCCDGFCAANKCRPWTIGST
ncbi:hypothetical protein VP1G_06239 [Cytospora mali]|uniref:Uncharacterized protein n=1 Tax=Cytospora mali TaxID=578113 RepID=A0A194V533_CYTMA|nr:hypothetical protein VP1G_06239 [Valsa mali var. pyri (nom. inval.)]